MHALIQALIILFLSADARLLEEATEPICQRLGTYTCIYIHTCVRLGVCFKFDGQNIESFTLLKVIIFFYLISFFSWE